MFVKHLGRTPSVIAAVCAAIICASLSGVTAGPIPSLAPRGGKRFQCADATHFFTNDDNSETTRCPGGTVCGAMGDGSPCVAASQGSNSTQDRSATGNTDTASSGPPNKAAGGTPAYPESGSDGGAVEASALPDGSSGKNDETCVAEDAEEEPYRAIDAKQVGLPSETVPTENANDGTTAESENTEASAATETSTDAPVSESEPPVESVSPPEEESLALSSGDTALETEDYLTEEKKATGEVPQQPETPSTGQKPTEGAGTGSETTEPQGQVGNVPPGTGAADTQAGKTTDQGNAGAGDTPNPGANDNPVTAIGSNAATGEPGVPAPSPGLNAPGVEPGSEQPLGLAANAPSITNAQVKQTGQTNTDGAVASGSANGNTDINNRGIHTDGEFTHYDTTGTGACGKASGRTITSEPYYAALPAAYFKAANPNLDPVCGKQIRASYGDKEVLLQVADKCPEGECKVDDIDMQEPAFIKLFGDLGVGRKGEGTTWQFV